MNRSYPNMPESGALHDTGRTMNLIAGSRIGPYEILAPLGAGGMGEVFRARDTKLNRDVAIKVLPAAFAQDKERVARFRREAQMLASLNHPNIAAIYGLEESGGLMALALELVEGEDLAQRLSRGAIPVDEGVAIAKQIAEGLEAAHEKGIVHRDLKLANVKLSVDGVVKILDFGLAKAYAGDSAAGDSGLTNSPTLSRPMTELGVILGTAAYMSPEQARGKPVDRRADIWSFGVVLFEMLTGRRLFMGETISDTLAAVLTREIDWTALPAATPVRLRVLLERCLDRDPRARLRDIGEARIALATKEPVAAPELRRRRAWWPALLAAAAVGALAFLAGRLQQRAPESTWTGTRLGGPEIAIGPRISPDGHTLAFQAMVGENTQVAVMKPDSGNWLVLTHKAGAGIIQAIAWSADGNRLYCDRVADVPMGVYSVPVLGGDEQLVLEDAQQPEPLPDGSLLLLRLNADRALQLFRFWPDSGRLQGFPLVSDNTIPMLRLFPDGKEAAVVARLVGSGDSADHVYAVEPDSGKVRRIQTGLPDDSITALSTTIDNASVLLAVRPGDLTRLVTVPRNGGHGSHPLFTLTETVHYADMAGDGSIYVDTWVQPRTFVRFPVEGGAASTIAMLATTGTRYVVPLADGSLVVQQIVAGRPRLVALESGKDPVPIVMTNEETAAPMTAVGAGELAFLIGGEPRRTIALASLSNGRVTRRIPFDKGPIVSLAASPDGKTLYGSAGGSIWAIPASGEPRRICAGQSVAADPSGQSLLVQLIEAPKARLLRVPLDVGAPREIALNGPFHLTWDPLNSAGISRDGRLLAPLASLDSWFFFPGVIDLATGRMTRIKTDHFGDYHSVAWSPDGQAVAVSNELRSAIWKVMPEGH